MEWVEGLHTSLIDISVIDTAGHILGCCDGNVGQVTVEAGGARMGLDKFVTRLCDVGGMWEGPCGVIMHGVSCVDRWGAGHGYRDSTHVLQSVNSVTTFA